MRKAAVRRVPVVDEQGALRGLLSLDDILEHIEEEVRDLAELVGRGRERERETRGP
jgi:Mg/Co/Ni transporter MgtE